MIRNAPSFRGKVVVSGEMLAVTGLRIGAATSGLEIGGVDQPVLRDPVTNQPYVPGSSLKGKLRSLVTRSHGLPLEGLGRAVEVRLHRCTDESAYRDCPVCPTFGLPGGDPFVTPTRLIVRDARLKPELQVVEEGSVSRKLWKEVDTDLPYSEVKVEVALDVVTAASNPRQMERVPPGALFETELLFTVYRSDVHGLDPQKEQERLREVVAAMRLLEDDYLGSSGTRGYGKVKFQRLRVSWRPLDYYRDPAKHREEVLWEGDHLTDLLAGYEENVARNVWGQQG